VVIRYDAQRTSASTLHQVIGRADPIVTPRPSGLPVGAFDIVCPSLDEARNLEELLAHGYVWMLRQTDQDNLDFYFVVTDTRLTHSDEDWTQTPRPERRWTLAVSYAQIAQPGPDFVPIFGWTYAVVTAQYVTYADLLGTYASYVDLLTRNPIP
jgi:hypothetical protein